MSFLRFSRGHRPGGRLGRHRAPRKPGTAIAWSATAAGLGLVVASMTGLGSPASADIVAASPAQLGAALGSASVTTTGTSYVTNRDVASNGVATSQLGDFPTDGSTFSILTNGLAASADDPNVNVDDLPNISDDVSTDLGGASVRGAFDASILEMDVSVPTGANCLTVDFQFLSEEYPEFVGQQFNDAFVAELDTNDWSVVRGALQAPHNFAFDPSHAPISINAVGNTSMSTAHAAGTTYDGATPALTATTPVTPGTHSLYFSIFDAADHEVDSAVFLDNLRVGTASDDGCMAGAAPKSYVLGLTTETPERLVGDQASVSATVADSLTGAPSGGASVTFSVAGANAASGAAATDANGIASFNYVGVAAGTDVVTACLDGDGDGSCGEGEVSDDVTVVWETPESQNTEPTIEAGPDTSGVEGQVVALTGGAGDADGDALTTTWSVEARPGVDTGATCLLADAHALETTLICDDDGTFRLTLTVGDGAAEVSDFLDVVVANADPMLQAVDSDVSPGTVGVPVVLSAGVTDRGTHDTQSATVEWGDGSTSEVAVTGGSLSGSHAYADPGLYHPCVTVFDDDGGTDRSCTADEVVVGDSAAHLVTAGGQFALPDGVDKWARGVIAVAIRSSGADGARGVVLVKAGPVCLTTTRADWLVVSEDNAVFSGAGMVNGRSGYRYLLSLTDGGSHEPDLIRVKVWSVNSGDVVLDTQPGAPASATPTTLVQGNVAVHR